MREAAAAFTLRGRLPAAQRVATIDGAVSRPDHDDPLDAAWAALLADWDSDERHRGFVGLAATLERLPDAAKRYRAESANPSRAGRAKQGLDRVLGVAMQSLTPVQRPERPRPVNVMIPLATMAAVILVTLVAAQATGFRALTSPVVILGEVVIVALVPWRRFAPRSE